ncbi:MAG: hypothetical protein NT062_04080 [Proteobacteria bacterium]|nr:hypothetical protein [Pseudomonadota bacterium]
MRRVALSLTLVACGGGGAPPIATTPATTPVAMPEAPVGRVSATRSTAVPKLPHPVAAQFGTFSPLGFHEQDELPLVVNSQFMWRIQLPCSEPVEYRETFVTPAPTTWGAPDPSTIVGDDGALAEHTELGECRDGWVENIWTINASDPPGEWTLTVDIKGFASTVFHVRFVQP